MQVHDVLCVRRRSTYSDAFKSTAPFRLFYRFTILHFTAKLLCSIWVKGFYSYLSSVH